MKRLASNSSRRSARMAGPAVRVSGASCPQTCRDSLSMCPPRYDCAARPWQGHTAARPPPAPSRPLHASASSLPRPRPSARPWSPSSSQSPAAPGPGTGFPKGTSAATRASRAPSCPSCAPPTAESGHGVQCGPAPKPAVTHITHEVHGLCLNLLCAEPCGERWSQDIVLSVQPTQLPRTTRPGKGSVTPRSGDQPHGLRTDHAPK